MVQVKLLHSLAGVHYNNVDTVLEGFNITLHINNLVGVDSFPLKECWFRVSPGCLGG